MILLNVKQRAGKGTGGGALSSTGLLSAIHGEAATGKYINDEEERYNG